MNTLTIAAHPIKMWTDGVPVEQEAQQQLINIANLPFIHGHVAVMPDVHLGKGATVGSVIATRGAIVPAAVGVDIGCVDADSEYLSPKGWKRIADYDGDKVMQYEPNGGLGRYVRPNAFIKDKCTEFLWFKTKYGIDQRLSDEHRMLIYRPTGRDYHQVQEVIDAAVLVAEHDRLILGSKVKFETIFTPMLDSQLDLNQAQLRVQVMLMADGCFDKRRPNSPVVLKFRKQRKILRARQLLTAANIFYKESLLGNGDIIFSFQAPIRTKTYANMWSASLDQLKIISDECLRWDGHKNCFSTCDRASANFIQYAFIATGKRAVMRIDRKNEYRVFANSNTRVGIAGVPKSPITRVASIDGFKYCFRVPSGFWVMRRGGNVVMTGNCGMIATRTNLTASDLPDSLHSLRIAIEAQVPVGHDSHANPPRGSEHVWGLLRAGYERIEDKHPKIALTARGKSTVAPVRQVGTLGGGNHFIELCLDEADRLWVFLHSGSRGVGNRIGSYFMEQARRRFDKADPRLSDLDLSWLDEGTEAFDDYVEAVGWAQDYAATNRMVMLKRTIESISTCYGRQVYETDLAVNCHHNYVTRETHLGASCWVTRKGAVRAGVGEYGLIPGSMGQRSYVVRGLGNEASFLSCSHGAGRVMSRSRAKRELTVEQHREWTHGVECRKDEGVLDEARGAYKDVDAVMAAQRDLVEVMHMLRAVLCVKG